MNISQKNSVIVGSTAFIFWLILAIDNGAFRGATEYATFWDNFFVYGVYFVCRSGSPNCGAFASVVNLTFFTAWFGSLIAFFVHKD